MADIVDVPFNDDVKDAILGFVGSLKIAMDSNPYNTDETYAIVVNNFDKLQTAIAAAKGTEEEAGNGGGE